jgi:hypothetical protein
MATELVESLLVLRFASQHYVGLETKVFSRHSKVKAAARTTMLGTDDDNCFSLGEAVLIQQPKTDCFIVVSLFLCLGCLGVGCSIAATLVMTAVFYDCYFLFLSCCFIF